MDNIQYNNIPRIKGDDNNYYCDDITLQCKEMAFNSAYSVDTFVLKLNKFSEFLNDIATTTLLRSIDAGNHKERLISVLINLKKNVKTALESIGNSLTNRSHEFTCTICSEELSVRPSEDMWEVLTSHEHFEQMFSDFLTAKPINSYNCSNETDSEELSESLNEEKLESSHYESDIEVEGDNTFRFNFPLKYDDSVENKIYPHNLISSIKGFDKQDHSIMKAGRKLAVCLVCPCEMKKGIVSKPNLIDHAAGQRHIRACSTLNNLQVLEGFHRFWLKQTPQMQVFQVYFRPTEFIGEVKCMLCNIYMKYPAIHNHLYNNQHKRRVSDLFVTGSSMYFLVEEQMKMYGIPKELLEAREVEAEKNRATNTKSATIHDKNQVQSNDTNKKKEHEIIESVEIPDSTDHLELLPYRYKKHKNFIKRYETKEFSIIKCELCIVTLLENVTSIKNHIVQTVHTRLSKLDFKGYKYYCDVCSIKFKDETQWNRHFQGAIYKHVNLEAKLKMKLKEYECIPCKTVIYGDKLSTEKHCQTDLRAENNTRFLKEIFLPDEVKTMFKSHSAITDVATKLQREAEGVLEDNVTLKCCQRIATVLSELFTQCSVHPFGSRVSGLGDKTSDLDIFVNMGDMYDGSQNQDPLIQKHYVTKVAKIFRKHKEFANIVAVGSARTPIVKIDHTPTKLKCDLSFKHGLSVENTKFLRHCFTLQPITQFLILLVKKWAHFVCFDQDISNYSLSIMVIFFLQVNGYLLSVAKIRELSQTTSKQIGGWVALTYDIPIKEIRCNIQLYNGDVIPLLKQFFNYYAKFNYTEDVICPLLGTPIKRTLFTTENGKNLPQEMSLYLHHVKLDEEKYFKSHTPMCVQDPFDLGHNLTKSCHSNVLAKFKHVCELTLRHLDSIR